MDAEKQIKQMVNFILQEAREKASEISSKAEQDFHAEKQLKVHQAKMKILGDIKSKEKEGEIQRRITRSIVNAEVRVRKMQKREEMVQRVKSDCLQRVIKTLSSDQKQYELLLKQLLVQSMIKLNESKLEVLVRELDVRTVQKIIPVACKEYEELILKECGETIKMDVKLSKKQLPGPSMGDGTPSCAGGLKVSCRDGRVVLDNTIDSRLEIAFADLMPTIRKQLFSTRV